MKISEAKKILGVVGSSTPEELSLFYRNLAQKAKDVKELIAISSAYIQLQQDTSRRDSDINSVFEVDKTMSIYFNKVREEYSTHAKKIKSDLKTTIDNKIDYTTQTNELKHVVENDISTEIQHSVTYLSQYLRSLDERVTTDQRHSLARVFYPLYKERQRRWLKRFYSTPQFRLEVVFIVVVAIVKYIFDILNVFPSVIKCISINFPDVLPILSILSSTVSQYLIEIIGSVTLALLSSFMLRFWQLGPETQLITPRLSEQGIREITANEARKIGLSDLDWLKRGGIGALGALIFDPTFILSSIAAVIGLFTFFFNHSFGEQKQKTKARLWNEVNRGFQEVDTSVGHWLTISERISQHEMIKSIAENCNKLSGLFIGYKLDKTNREAS